LATLSLFLHQHIPESPWAKSFFLTLDNIKPSAKNRLKIRLLKEVVITALMHGPVLCPRFLTRDVLEAGTEDGEMEIACLLQQHSCMLAVGWPFRFLDVVKETGID
jgi:hypothetical protein